MLDGCGIEHNAPVPRIARPDLPNAVEEAVEVFGSRVRVAVIRTLQASAPQTKAELKRLLGGSEANLHAHLSALEDAGVLIADPSRTDEAGPVTRRYSVDRDRLGALLAALADAVGEPRPRRQ